MVHMSRRRTLLVLALAVCMAAPTFWIGGPAAGVDIKTRYDKALAELRDLQANSKRLADDYDKLLREIDTADAKIADLQGQVQTITRFANERRERIHAIAIDTYKYGALPVRRLSATMSTKSFNEVAVAEKYLGETQQHNLESLRTFSGSSQALDVAQHKFEVARQERLRMHNSLQEERQNIEALIDRQEQVVAELNEKLPAEQMLTLSSASSASSISSIPSPRSGSQKLQPPPELLAYGNGRIPPEALEAIGIGKHRLWSTAAAAFRQMFQDALSAGVTIGVTDSYRSYEAQVDVARRKGLYKSGGLAATPGTSNHGWGMALDLDLDFAAQQWMRSNAGQYGWVEDTPRESWHWGYHGHTG